MLVDNDGLLMFGILVRLEPGASEEGRKTATVLCETGESVRTTRFTPMEPRRASD